MQRTHLVRRALAAAVGLAVIAAGFVSNRAEAAAPNTFGATTGFSSPMLTYEPAADMNADLDAEVAAGASWVRVDLAWSYVESTKGTYRWTSVDNVVNGATARGLKVLLTLAYAPSWATGCAGTDKCLPTD